MQKASGKAASYLLTVLKIQVVCKHTLLMRVALVLAWGLWKIQIVPSTWLYCSSGVFVTNNKTG